MNVILGITGSVAATLTQKMAGALIEAGHNLQIVSTTPGLYFLPQTVGEELEVKINDGKHIVKIPLFRDKYEWPANGYHKNDPVRHIEFQTWADVLLIAPLSANTLAKIANGICDNFLCCIARAWIKGKPFIVAPAMNTEMWTDSITSEQLNTLSNRFHKFHKVPPIEGNLACGVTGYGAMARIEDIIKAVDKYSS